MCPTNSEHNQEVTLYPQELKSALLIQMLSQVHLTGSTLHNCLRLPQFLSICKFSYTISYQLLYISDHHVPHRVATNSDTTHPQVIYLTQDNSLI